MASQYFFELESVPWDLFSLSLLTMYEDNNYFSNTTIWSISGHWTFSLFSISYRRCPMNRNNGMYLLHKYGSRFLLFIITFNLERKFFLLIVLVCELLFKSEINYRKMRIFIIQIFPELSLRLRTGTSYGQNCSFFLKKFVSKVSLWSFWLMSLFTDWRLMKLLRQQRHLFSLLFFSPQKLLALH